MNKENINRFIYMYILVLVVIIIVQLMFLDGINWASTIVMPALVSLLSIGFRSNVKKDEEIARKDEEYYRKNKK